MYDDPSSLDWQGTVLFLTVSFLALVFVASVFVAVARFIWFHGRPAWLRNVLLAVSAVGLILVLASVLRPGTPWWVALAGLGLGVGPLSTWLALRAFACDAPPFGLSRAPEALEIADAFLDTLGERSAALVHGSAAVIGSTHVHTDDSSDFGDGFGD